MKKNLFLVLFFIFFLYGCGGGGSASGGIDSTTPVKTAYFYDSAVNGLEYSCGTKITGLTGDTDIDGIVGNNKDINGSFRYQSDCTVEFKIGKIHLGSVAGSSLSSASKIYPTTILGLDNTTIDERVENMLVFLQTLDNDSNLSNGIAISSSTRDTLTNSPLINNSDFISNFKTTLSDLNTTINTINSVNSTNYLLVSKDEALLHFQETLKNTANITINLSNPKPYLVDKYGRTTTLTSIKTANTISKDIIIKGKAGTKIFLAFNSTGSTTGLSFVDTNKTIGSDRNGYLTLGFNDDTISHFHYFIKLLDSDNVASEILHLDVEKDVIPPHVEASNIIEDVLEEQLLFRNIQATDAGGIMGYNLINISEDNRSSNYDLFTIDTNGTITFKTEPNFDTNINAIFQVVARAIDYVGNMTDLLLQVRLKNVLDNPPKLTSIYYTTSLMEGDSNGTVVFDLSDTLEQNLTIAPDNDPTLSPIYYNLHNHTDIFDINRSTGVITIKDNTNGLFDYEQLPNTIDLNVSVENNNSHPLNDINKTHATLTVNITNRIDTAPKLISPSSLSIPEKSSSYTSNYPIGGVLIDTSLSDKNTTMTFSITNGNDGNFTIDSDTGIIYTIANNHLDYEIKSQYTLTIRATNTWWNGNVTYDEVNQTINITNVRDNAPSIALSTLTNTLPESTSSNTTIATIDVNGTIEDANVTTSYTIDTVLKNGIPLSAGAIPFTINNIGVFSTSRQLLSDYEESISNTIDTVFTITVKALNTWWDGSTGTSNPITFDLNITNVIDNAPVISLSPALINFDENTTIGTQIYDINTSGTTYDTNTVTSFSIVSGNSENKFDINTTTGIITLKNSLDWETTTSYTLGVQASNINWNGTTQLSNTVSLTVNINNIIETPPSITGSTTLNIHENIDIGEVIASIEINSTEEDKKTVDSFNIVGGNGAGKFSLSSIKTDTSTNLKYVDLQIANNLDYETTNTYTLDINASNSFGNSTHTVTINIVDDVEKNLPLLITMIEYNDINITTTTSDVFNKIFSQNPPTPPAFGSLNDYFYRVSKTKFIFLKATETYGSGDGIIKISLNRNHPQTDINSLEQDIRDALIASDTYVNFSNYDVNNDGNISKNELQLVFMIAGGERTYGDTNLSIQSASGSLNTNLTLDGKNIASTGGGNYVVVGEKNGENLASIGLIAHHLGNTALNFPYLNDRTKASYGIGFFGLMGYGYRGVDGNSSIGTTPVNPSAYSILSQGWVFPKTIDKTTQNIQMIASNKGVDGFNIIKIPTNDAKIYYLLENRVKTNLVGYDDGFFAMENTSFNGGLALWKIDENYENNDQVNTKLVDLIEYDNNTDINTKLSYGKSSALYHVGNPTYPSNLGLPFSISNSSLETSPPTNKMTIDITFP